MQKWEAGKSSHLSMIGWIHAPNQYFGQMPCSDKLVTNSSWCCYIIVLLCQLSVSRTLESDFATYYHSVDSTDLTAKCPQFLFPSVQKCNKMSTAFNITDISAISAAFCKSGCRKIENSSNYNNKKHLSALLVGHGLIHTPVCCSQIDIQFEFQSFWSDIKMVISAK